jgi:hypothetical protein
VTADPRDVWEAILHDVALARADRPSTPRERAIARALREHLERLISSDSGSDSDTDSGSDSESDPD